uniref:Uncharacterized protein n=1 Tax=Onchocerca volvulus TaxID=6282 RepID=A0A8R1XVX9_ONCVO
MLAQNNNTRHRIENEGKEEIKIHAAPETSVYNTSAILLQMESRSIKREETEPLEERSQKIFMA